MLPVQTSPNETQAPPSTSPSLEADDKSASKVAGRWTKEEHELFVDGLKKFGKNWKKIEEHVGTRSGAQIRSHAQKFFLRMNRDVTMRDKYPLYSLHGHDLSSPIRKVSGSSHSTDISYQDELLAKISHNNLQKYLELNKRFEAQMNLANLLDKQLSNYPSSISEVYMLNALQQQRQRKMSLDAYNLNSMQNPLLDALASNMNINSSPLSLELSRLSGLLGANQNQRLINQNMSNNINLNAILSMNNLAKNNFCFNESTLANNLRKLSEDNILIQQKPSLIPKFNPTQMSEFESLVKQVKKF